MGDHDELGLMGQAAQGVGETSDVGFVKGGVHFVQDAERDRSNFKHREQERDRGQRAFPAREHGEGLWLLAGWSRHDLHAGRTEVRRVRQRQLREATAEQLLEPRRERRLQGPERCPEAVRDHRVQLGDEVACAHDGGPQVRILGLERLQPDAEGRVLIHGIRVHRSQLVEASTELAEANRAGCRQAGWLRGPDRHGPIDGGLERRHFVRYGAVVARRVFGEDRNTVVLARCGIDRRGVHADPAGADADRRET